MTTIVYRDGVLVADSRAYSGNKQPIGSKTKIFYDEASGRAFGCSSTTVGFGERFRLWMIDHPGYEDDSFGKDAGFTAILIENGAVFIYEDSLCPTGPLTADYFAIGSGREAALGAMAMGADAVRAVAIACEIDVWSQGPLTRIDVSVLEAARKAKKKAKKRK